MLGRISSGRRFQYAAIALLFLGPISLAEGQPAPEPVPTETVDERLRIEEEWAAAEHARQKAEVDGGTKVPIPPPGQKPKGAFDDIMTAVTVSILGIIAGAAWGGRRKGRGKKRR